MVLLLGIGVKCEVNTIIILDERHKTNNFSKMVVFSISSLTFSLLAVLLNIIIENEIVCDFGAAGKFSAARLTDSETSAATVSGLSQIRAQGGLFSQSFASGLREWLILTLLYDRIHHKRNDFAETPSRIPMTSNNSNIDLAIGSFQAIDM